jgi:DNA invertase Pin-like site-specific DNA recombinase
MKVARIYIRVSTEQQDLERQEKVVTDAEAQGYYIAGVYREKASGARADRPEMLRLIADLKEGDVVIAEKMDRISRLPLDEAEALIEKITKKGARLAIPGVVDLSSFTVGADPTAKIVLEMTQAMLLKLALQMARDDYETRIERRDGGIAKKRALDEALVAQGKPRQFYKGRKANDKLHASIIKLRTMAEPASISETAETLGCSQSLVKSVMAQYKKAQAQEPSKG